MLTRRALLSSTLLLFSAFCFSRFTNAQISSTAASVTLNATLAETLTVSATPAAVNFSLVSGGVAVGSAPIAINSSWILGTVRANVRLFAWFATPSAALTDGASTPNVIPSSEVLGQVTTGTPTTYTPFTQSNALGVANGGLLLFTQPLSASNRSLSRTDNLSLEINLGAQPQLPAGTYTGLINIQAQAL